jgi:hypothetical protein
MIDPVAEIVTGLRSWISAPGAPSRADIDAFSALMTPGRRDLLQPDSVSDIFSTAALMGATIEAVAKFISMFVQGANRLLSIS